MSGPSLNSACLQGRLLSSLTGRIFKRAGTRFTSPLPDEVMRSRLRKDHEQKDEECFDISYRGFAQMGAAHTIDDRLPRHSTRMGFPVIPGCPNLWAHNRSTCSLI